MSRACRTIPILLLLGLVMPITRTAEAAPRPERPRPAGQAARLAAVDSLLAAGAVEAAAGLASRGLGEAAATTAGTWQWRERLAIALARLGRPAEAVPQLEAALQEAPGVASLHATLGRVLAGMGRPGRALHELEEASALAPGDWEIALDHARVLHGLGLRRQAVERFEEASGLCGGCPPATRALAALHVEAGEHAAALPHLRALQETDPTPWSRRALALGLVRTGAPEEARLLLAPLWPDSLDDEERTLLLEADRLRGDGGRALAAATGPGLPGASARFWGLAGLLLLETDRPAGALAALERAVALAPEDSVHQNNLVVALTRLGRHEEARQLRERRSGAPRSPEPAGRIPE